MKKTVILLLILFTLILAAGCSGQDSSNGGAGSYEDLIFDNTMGRRVGVALKDRNSGTIVTYVTMAVVFFLMRALIDSVIDIL